MSKTASGWSSTVQRSCTKPTAEFHDLTYNLLIDLLTQTGVEVPPGSRVEMMIKPTLSEEARSHCDRAMLLLYRATGSLRNDPEEQQQADQLNREALVQANAALDADRNYILAYVAKASALKNLDDDESTEECLRAGRNCLGTSPVDTLSELEFKGDYQRFFERRSEDADEFYAEMLKISPGHLRALWSSLECLVRDTGAVIRRADIERATTLTGRIIAAHPKSSMAQFFLRGPGR